MWRIYLVHPTALPHCLHGSRSSRIVYLPWRPSSVILQFPKAVYPPCSQTHWYCPVLVNWNFAGWANSGMEHAKGKRGTGGWHCTSFMARDFGEKYSVLNTLVARTFRAGTVLVVSDIAFQTVFFLPCHYHNTKHAHVQLSTANIRGYCQDIGRPGSFESGELIEFHTPTNALLYIIKY